MMLCQILLAAVIAVVAVAAAPRAYSGEYVCCVATLNSSHSGMQVWHLPMNTETTASLCLPEVRTSRGIPSRTFAVTCLISIRLFSAIDIANNVEEVQPGHAHTNVNSCEESLASEEAVSGSPDALTRILSCLNEL